MIPLTGGPWRSHIHRDRKQMVGAGWGQGRGWEAVFTGVRVSVWEGEKVLEVDAGDGGTTVCVHLRPLSCAVKKIVKMVNFTLYKCYCK